MSLPIIVVDRVVILSKHWRLDINISSVIVVVHIFLILIWCWMLHMSAIRILVTRLLVRLILLVVWWWLFISLSRSKIFYQLLSSGAIRKFEVLLWVNIVIGYVLTHMPTKLGELLLLLETYCQIHDILPDIEISFLKKSLDYKIAKLVIYNLNQNNFWSCYCIPHRKQLILLTV